MSKSIALVFHALLFIIRAFTTDDFKKNINDIPMVKIESI